MATVVLVPEVWAAASADPDRTTALGRAAAAIAVSCADIAEPSMSEPDEDGFTVAARPNESVAELATRRTPVPIENAGQAQIGAGGGGGRRRAPGRGDRGCAHTAHTARLILEPARTRSSRSPHH
ncbi:hypothetical protein [Actinophytocola sp.]|uniref:hypothetical protein n=1 Tax=Actinophytocola sp. TaxID=1872138 RepID=UPI003899B859